MIVPQIPSSCQMSFVFILTVPKESLGPQRKILSFYKVLSVNSELKHFLDNCNYFLSTSCVFFVKISGLDFTGIQNAALYLFREPILHLNGEPFSCPETVYLKTVLKKRGGSLGSASAPGNTGAGSFPLPRHSAGSVFHGAAAAVFERICVRPCAL